MRSFAVLLAICLVALVANGLAQAQVTPPAEPPLATPSLPPAPQVVGGQPAEQAAWPWVAMLISADNPEGQVEPYCGGTLIRPDWVLTAAHCVTDLAPGDIAVVLGRQNVTSTAGERIAIRDIRVYPLYDRATFDDGDLALLRLARPAKEQPATLVSPEEAALLAAPGRPATVVGWGSLNTLDPLQFPELLQQLTLPITSDTACARAYNDTLSAGQLCAGEPTIAGRDACFGDSGSPLMVQGAGGTWRVIGITSFGVSCAVPAFPGVYTRIATYTDWIEAQIAGTSTLAIAQTAPISAAPGRAIDLTLFLANTGPTVLRDIVVTTTVPLSSTFVRASDGGQRDGSTVRWVISRLAADRVVKRHLTMTASRSITATATVAQAPNGLSAATGYLPHVAINQPLLSLNLDGSNQITVGAALAYTVTVKNEGQGPKASAQGAAVSLTLPTGIEADAVEARGGELVEPNQVRWVLPSLAPDDQRDFTLVVTPTMRGLVTLSQAEVRLPSGIFWNSESLVATQAVAPELHSDLQGPQRSDAGATITYTLSVTNSGELPASALVISVPLPLRSAVLRLSPDGGILGGSAVWDRGKLNPGERAVYTITLKANTSITFRDYAVEARDPEGRTITATQEHPIVETAIEPPVSIPATRTPAATTPTTQPPNPPPTAASTSRRYLAFIVR